MKKFLCAVWVALVPGIVQAAVVPMNSTGVERELGVTENWTEFFFDLENKYSSGSEGSWFVGVPNGDELGLAVVTFTFSAAYDMLLQITDAWQSGDIFGVFIEGFTNSGTRVEKAVFTETVDLPQVAKPVYDSKGNLDPGNSGHFIGTPDDFDDFDEVYNSAFLDGEFSSGSWRLEAGDYEVTGFIHQQSFTFGPGAIRVTYAPVPLPASFGLMLGAGAVLGAMAARRRTRATRREI